MIHCLLLIWNGFKLQENQLPWNWKKFLVPQSPSSSPILSSPSSASSPSGATIRFLSFQPALLEINLLYHLSSFSLIPTSPEEEGEAAADKVHHRLYFSIFLPWIHQLNIFFSLRFRWRPVSQWEMWIKTEQIEDTAILQNIARIANAVHVSLFFRSLWMLRLLFSIVIRSKVCNSWSKI